MKRLALLVVVALVASGSTLAIASSQRERTAPSRETGPTLAEITDLEQRLDRVVHAPRVNCRTFACINKTLTKQGKAIKKLKRDVKLIRAELTQCQVVQGISQFGDFAAVGGGATTGLDFDDSGDPEMWALAWICGVV